MPPLLGRIESLLRYPVKSMAGQAVDNVALGWHGLEGDRRHAFRRVGEHGGFPWLTAGRLPDLLRYRPLGRDDAGAPTHVRTPDGRELPLTGDQLRDEIQAAHGAALELMHLNQGIFDEAPVSVIAACTVDGIARAAERPADFRRFRPNVLMRTVDETPFHEDAWVGKVLVFGDEADAPAVAITLKDRRCLMINMDPDTAVSDPAVMKAAVKLNHNDAGVYATVVRTGRLTVGQPVYLRAAL